MYIHCLLLSTPVVENVKLSKSSVWKLEEGYGIFFFRIIISFESDEGEVCCSSVVRTCAT